MSNDTTTKTTVIRADQLREFDKIVAVEMGNGEQRDLGHEVPVWEVTRVNVVGRGECVSIISGPSSESTLALHERVTIVSRETTPSFELTLSELDDIRHSLTAQLRGSVTDAQRERLVALAEKLDPWKVVMNNWKSGVYGTPDDVRRYATRELEERLAGSGEGIGSSDINHTVYSMARSGQISPDHPATIARIHDEFGFGPRF